jgi:PKD repeat protein
LNKNNTVKTISTLAIITILGISMVQTPNGPPEYQPDFLINCEQNQVFIGELVYCSLSDITNVQGYLVDFHDGSPIVFQNSFDLNFNHKFNDSGVFQVTIIGFNQFNLTTIKTYTIDVIPPFPNLEIKADNTNPFEDQPVSFSILNVDYGSDMNYTWDLGDGSTKYGSNIVHSYQKSGLYFVKFLGISKTGLMATRYLNITVNNFQPIAKMQITNSENQSLDVLNNNGPQIKSMLNSIEDQTLMFDALNSIDTISDLETLKFLWDFSDGSFSNQPRVNHTYSLQGIYNVKLTVSDDDGALDTISANININNEKPIIEYLNVKNTEINEGETFIFESLAKDTYSDLPNLKYLWNFGKNGWIATKEMYNNGDLQVNVTVTDDDNESVTSTNLSLKVNNIAPYISLQNLISTYNLTFSIMGEKWHDINITIFDENFSETIAEGYMIRYAEDPWENNLTFYNLNHQLMRKWKVEVLYSPEDDPINGQDKGANPVQAVFYFNDNENNYTLHNTFNVEHPETYNWTFYIDPLIWGLPITFEYQVFDPGRDDITITTVINNQNFSNFIAAPESGSTHFDYKTTFTVANISSLSYFATDSDGGVSKIYNVPISIFESNNRSVNYISDLAPIIIWQGLNEGIEDEWIPFRAISIDTVNSTFSYKWSFGDQTSSTLANPKHRYAYEGVYLVWVIVSDGHFETATGRWITIHNQAPTAVISPLPSEIFEDDKVLFQANATIDTPSDVKSLKYIWEFGDGSVGVGKLVKHSFAVEGIYNIKLIVIDDQGAESVVIRSVVVKNSAPLITEEFDMLNGLEGNTLTVEPKYFDSKVDRLFLEYTVEIAGTVQTGKITSWNLPAGEYLATLTVNDLKGGTAIHRFAVIIQNKTPIVQAVDYFVYGRVDLTISIPLSADSSLFNSNNLEYCFEVELSNEEKVECNWQPYTNQISQIELNLTKSREGYHFINTKIRIQNGNGNGNESSDENTFKITRSSNDNSYSKVYESTSLLRIIIDSDGDQLPDILEIMAGTDPFNPDTDGDGIADPFETAIYLDTDLSQFAEFSRLFFATDPTNIDTDGDGIPDGYFGGYGELVFGTDPLNPDTDGDGLTDGQEIFGWTITVTIAGQNMVKLVRSDPLNPDTDGDGLTDYEEYLLGSDPTKVDTDEDGLSDFREQAIGTSLINDDTDGDGLTDGIEVNGWEIRWFDVHGVKHTRHVFSDPWRNDTDGDGLTDLEEYNLGIDPSSKDTDQDGLLDSEELAIAIPFITGTSCITRTTTYTIFGSTRTHTYTICSPTIEYRPTKPYDADSDGDGLLDGVEVKGWNITIFNPSGALYSEDGSEILSASSISTTTRLITTNPLRADSDSDGITDYDELFPSDPNRVSDPRNPDSDGDGIPDHLDDMPLMVEFRPPDISNNIALTYDIPAITKLEGIIESLYGSLDLLKDLLDFDLIWDLVKNNPRSIISSKISPHVKEQLINYLTNSDPERTWDFSSIRFQNYKATADYIISEIAASFQKSLNLIKNWINFDQLWDAITSSLSVENILNGDITTPIRSYISNLVRDWINLFMNVDNTLIPSTLRSINIDFSFNIEFKTFFGIPYAIDKFTISGVFDFIIDKLVQTGIKAITLLGNFVIDWWDTMVDISGVNIPQLTLEFEAYDSVGIDYIKLWVNRGVNHQPTYTQEFDGEQTAHFMWSEEVNLLNPCLPPPPDSGNGDDDQGDDEPTIPPEFPQPIPQFINYDEQDKDFSLQSGSINSVGCGDFNLKAVSVTILIVDVNGNGRLIQRSIDSFVVDFAGQVYKVFRQLFPVTAMVIDFFVEDLPQLFANGPQMLAEFQQNVIEYGEVMINLIEEGFRYVWENLVLRYLLEFKEQFYVPAKELVEQSLDNIEDNKDSLSANLFGTFRSELANNTVSKIDEVISEITTFIEPVANVVNAVSNFVRDLLTEFEEVVETITVVIEALQKLGELAIEILMDVLMNVLSGIIESLFSQLLNQFERVLEIFAIGLEPLALSLVDLLPLDSLEIDVEAMSAVDLLNPLSTINTLMESVMQVPNMEGIYHGVLNGMEGFMGFLLNFFVSKNFMNTGISGRDFIVALLTPVMSVVLAVSSLFGGSIAINSFHPLSLGKFNLNSSSTEQTMNHMGKDTGYSISNSNIEANKKIDGNEPNESNETFVNNSDDEYQKKIRVSLHGINYYKLFIGITQELLGALKEFFTKTGAGLGGRDSGLLSKDPVKLGISILRLALTAFDYLYLNPLRDGLQSEIDDTINVNTEFTTDRSKFLFWTAFLEASVDAIFVLGPKGIFGIISEQMVGIIKSTLYIVNAQVNLIKIVVDFQDMDVKSTEGDLQRHPYQVVGYLGSILENFLKSLRNLIKWAFEFADAVSGPEDHEIKKIIKDFGGIELKIRGKYITILDFIEDFLNMILYDYLRFEMSKYFILLIPFDPAPS